jgi:hypothetical protein
LILSTRSLIISFTSSHSPLLKNQSNGLPASSSFYLSPLPRAWSDYQVFKNHFLWLR